MMEIPRPNPNRSLTYIALLAQVLTLIACTPHLPLASDSAAQFPQSGPVPMARNQEFIVLVAQRGDTTRGLAAKYLGSPTKAWMIEDFNNLKNLMPGQEIAIPLRMPNLTGVYSNGYQTVPILCYHRFGFTKNKMVVAPEDFAQQMAFLAENDYRVLPMADLAEFIQGERALPRRTVIITMDDGYKSVYQHAFPILKKYGFPATLFIYTDFLGAREGLNWQEMQEMTDSKLIDIQPHSKSHSNLGIAEPEENEKTYRERIEVELRVPAQEIKRHLNLPIHTFAYPYGDTNQAVIDELKVQGYKLAVTVQAGSNPVFASPYMLQRSMVFGDQDMETFKKQIEAFETIDLR